MNKKYDISVFMPSIRTHKLLSWYESLEKSCKNYTFQSVIVGPFDLPVELKSKKNIKFYKSYGHPTKCSQIALSLCDGELVYHTTDDVLFYENSVDNCIDYYKNNLSKNDIISMRYSEGQNHSNNIPYDLSYWSMKSFYNSHNISNINIKEDWIYNAQFLVDKNFFIDFGGFDCQYEYLTHAAGDFLLRAQINNSKVFHSPVNVTSADWYPGTSVDHAPIHFAQITHDTPLFTFNWLNNINTNKIDFYNYMNYSDMWNRRFNIEKLPQKYEEI